MPEVFRKRQPGPLSATEAAGLRWLAAAGGVAVCPVLDVGPEHLVLERVVEVGATPAAAERFGRDLQRTHAAGAERFGAGPPGVGRAWIATLDLPLSDAPVAWGEFYAELRLRPYVRAARDAGLLSGDDAQVLDAVCARLADGAVPGADATPARLHGDLWSGNVLWSADGAVVIDPAAHGGHPETDLAMLALFGLPHLERVLDAYAEAAALAPGWRRRVPLHQLHPLLVHTVLFGGGYAGQAVRAARETLAL
ncbi:fructosamine kinase family protein [Kineococcus rhizosphaerae]|uniref:Fructosamine-3-kinase n=1 Tax=Kineococcus rhizosphaerae TaxID=559628 RepID=A0A2T0QXE1_9ACTN|nr:fructosamine kinase family protein [Kineococcus rhizosphaerae]PRY10451.1 fructosamine-3-kinase [Kineococcus rhizosphaerae]